MVSQRARFIGILSGEKITENVIVFELCVGNIVKLLATEVGQLVHVLARVGTLTAPVQW